MDLDMTTQDNYHSPYSTSGKSWMEQANNGRKQQEPPMIVPLTPPSESHSTATPSEPDEEKPIELDQRLLNLSNRTGYNLLQRNGQRIYGGPPPDWVGPPPEKGCEVFVGKVPRDCFEDELVPIFEQVGKIYELRLMMDFSGSNRGYMFVRFTHRDEAKEAVKVLNNYEIRPKKYIGVIGSVDNRKLWVSGIPKNRSRDEILAEMETLTDGVRDVILYPSQSDKSKTRGYAFVEYESHRAAALARRKLVPGKVFLLGQEIEKVDWAEPEAEIDEDIMNKVKVLFVRNLHMATDEDTIRRVFKEFLMEEGFEMEKADAEIQRVRKTKDYAFVHFATREAAEIAMDKSSCLIIDGIDVEVKWSKPVDKNTYNMRKTLTKILSNPPNVRQQFNTPTFQTNLALPQPTLDESMLPPPSAVSPPYPMLAPPPKIHSANDNPNGVVGQQNYMANIPLTNGSVETAPLSSMNPMHISYLANLTKLLTQQGNAYQQQFFLPPQMHLDPAMLSQLNAPIPSVLPYYNPGGNLARPFPPRKGGAAGIRGLGAPGTAPPRHLVRMINGNTPIQHHQRM